MAKRDNQDRENRYNNSGRGANRMGDDTPRSMEDDDRPTFETTIRAVSVVDELLSMTSPSDQKYQYLLLLRHQLEVD